MCIRDRRRVAQVHVYKLGVPVQEEPADGGAESLHGRDLHRGGRHLDLLGQCQAG